MVINKLLKALIYDSPPFPFLPSLKQYSMHTRLESAAECSLLSAAVHMRARRLPVPHQFPRQSKMALLVSVDARFGIKGSSRTTVSKSVSKAWG